MSDTSTFFLLDGHAIAYRAFFGMQGRRFQTRQGLPTGAVYGFTRILVDVIKSYQPTLLAVCFDTKEPTHRHEAYESYKGHRKPPPDDLILQFPYMQEMVAAFGIPIYRQPGFEADDLIGTLACRASAEGHQVRVITGDRDLFQLIDERIRILLPSKDTGFSEFGAAEVKQKYGYSPEQVVDFKALAGDSSDNIPGVKGIGEKTAIQLLSDYGSLEGIYAHLEQVTPKCRQKLVEGREDALLSQQLATIVCDAPVEFNPEACQLAEPKTEDLLKLFQNLEFNAFQKELPAILSYFKRAEDEIEIVSSWSEKRQLRPKVTIVSQLEEVEALIPILRAGPFAFDTETTGLDSVGTELVGISLACAGESADAEHPEENIRNWYLPVGHALITDSHLALPREAALALLKPVFEDANAPKFGHNAKFDINVLSLYGIAVAGVCDDTMIMDYLLQPESRHGLKELSQTYLQLEMQEITALIGTGRKQITMAEVPVEDAAVYAAADAVATWMLRERMNPDLQDKNLHKLYCEIEIPLMTVLAEMEQTGIKLDVPFLEALSQQLDQQLRKLEADLIQAAGENFNQNSPQQLSKVLFENLQLPTDGIKRNKTGAYSTDVGTLEKLRPFHPIIDQILEYRQLAKLKSTYVDAMPQLVNPRTGRLHTTFNQTVASTGRLSSTDPNLQNIPIRTELGRQMRKAFVASTPELRLVSCDYSQIELRLLAHFSEDPRFLQAFHEGGDIHAQTAVEIFNLTDLSQVTAEMRRIAKTTNFGIVYGQTAYGLARTLNIPAKEAAKIIQRFQERYSGVDSYMQATLEFARKHGYVETLFQRRRNLEDINHPNRNLREFSERVAINSPLQGTASDLIKLAMIRIQNWIHASGQPIQMLLQVHDELVFEMPEALLETAVPEIRRQMEEVWPLKVPLKVDTHAGINWMEAK